APPALVERLRHEVRVALHAREVVAEAAVGEVLEVTGEAADVPRPLGFLVDLLPAPAAAPAVEEAHQTVRVRVAVAQEAAEVFGDPRHRPARGAREAAFPEGDDLG